MLNKFISLAALTLLVSTSSYAGNVLIVNGSSSTSETGTTAAITNNLQTLHVAVGNTVTIADTVPLDLTGFSQVWDIRFSNSSPLTGAQQSEYLTFLAGGGGMFLMGENAGFTTRNDSLLAFVAAAGGGTLHFVSPNDSQIVLAPFTGPNGPVASVQYAASGGVDSKGTGDWITKVDGFERGTGVAFGVGDLTNAQAGALTLIFDVNFMQNQYDLPNSQNLTKNLIGFVGDQVEPPTHGVPDAGATFILVGAALIGLLQIRRATNSGK